MNLYQQTQKKLILENREYTPEVFAKDEFYIKLFLEQMNEAINDVQPRDFLSRLADSLDDNSVESLLGERLSDAEREQRVFIKKFPDAVTKALEMVEAFELEKWAVFVTKMDAVIHASGEIAKLNEFWASDAEDYKAAIRNAEEVCKVTNVASIYAIASVGKAPIQAVSAILKYVDQAELLSYRAALEEHAKARKQGRDEVLKLIADAMPAEAVPVSAKPKGPKPG